MISLSDTHFIMSTIAYVIGYILVCTSVGSIQAWLVAWLGDDTALNDGYGTFNPMMHVDFLGLFFLIAVGIGYRPGLPIDPKKFSGRFARARLLFAFFSAALCNILLSIGSYLILLIILGKSMYGKLVPLALYDQDHVSGNYLCQIYPDKSSGLIVFIYILLIFMYLNILIATINSIIALCDLAIMYIIDKDHWLQEYIDYFHYVLPFVLLLLIGTEIRVLFIKSIMIISYFITCVLHIN